MRSAFVESRANRRQNWSSIMKRASVFAMVAFMCSLSGASAAVPAYCNAACAVDCLVPAVGPTGLAEDCIGNADVRCNAGSVALNNNKGCGLPVTVTGWLNTCVQLPKGTSVDEVLNNVVTNEDRAVAKTLFKVLIDGYRKVDMETLGEPELKGLAGSLGCDAPAEKWQETDHSDVVDHDRRLEKNHPNVDADGKDSYNFVWKFEVVAGAVEAVDIENAIEHFPYGKANEHYKLFGSHVTLNYGTAVTIAQPNGACHATCKTCVSNLPSKCVTCATGLRLWHRKESHVGYCIENTN